jgi:hypothetical protein
MTTEEIIEEHYGYFLECFPQFEALAEQVGREVGLTTQQAAVAFMRFLRHISGDGDGGGEEVTDIEGAVQFLRRAA